MILYYVILYYIILYYIILYYIISHHIISLYIYIHNRMYIHKYIFIYMVLLTMYYYVGRIFIGFRMPKTWVETTVSESRSFDPMVPLIGILKKRNDGAVIGRPSRKAGGFLEFSWVFLLSFSVLLVFASGPKTVLVKRTFLQMWFHRSCRGGVGRGSMLRFLEVASLQNARLQRCVGVLHEWVAHNRGEFEKNVYRGMEKISCNTGTIDAAWSAAKDFIPSTLCSQSNHLLLYVKCCQWRYVNLHTHLQQKTISTLKSLFWKEEKKDG